jgi:hypothetical protein
MVRGFHMSDPGDEIQVVAAVPHFPHTLLWRAQEYIYFT